MAAALRRPDSTGFASTLPPRALAGSARRGETSEDPSHQALTEKVDPCGRLVGAAAPLDPSLSPSLSDALGAAGAVEAACWGIAETELAALICMSFLHR